MTPVAKNKYNQAFMDRETDLAPSAHLRPWQLASTRSLGFTLMLCCLTGCAATAPIQPANSSKSAFDGAVFKGQTISVSAGTPGNEAYRVFNQGSSGFVSAQSVSDDAEQRAKDFCDRKGKSMEVLRQTSAQPPYILGNFPRVEIVFECAERAIAATSPASEDPRYRKLVTLKKLLDSGVITQDEFDREKSKVLSQP